MIDYVGDLSKNDAELLRKLATTSGKILEFGVGASTQILAYYTESKVVSVETNPAWIEKTAGHLRRLGISEEKVCYKNWEQFERAPEGPYETIFNDGVDSLRLKFAMKSWTLLETGGLFCFHDTRRTADVKNVLKLLEKFSPWVDTVWFNLDHSNITVIKKKVAEFYEDWNVVEGKEQWQISGEAR